MINFIKGRLVRNPPAAGATGADRVAEVAAPPKSPATDPADGDRPGEVNRTIESALAREPAASPDRYEIRENPDGWSVYDKQTRATAETYGYRLAKMNRTRAESLVEVLNRGEVRRRGRNG